MPRWPSTSGMAAFIRDVLIPLGGLVGLLLDRASLDPIEAGAYLLMMGFPVAGYVDRVRRDAGDKPPAPREPGA